MVGKRTMKSSSSAQPKRSRSAAPPSYRKGRSSTTPRYSSRSMIDSEKRFLDTSGANLVVNDVGTVIPSLNLLPQGSGQGQRTGSKAQVVNLNVNFMFRLVPPQVQTTVGSGLVIRVLVGVDTECRGVPVQPTEILLDYNPQILQPLGFRNYIIASRFRILKDKMFTLNCAASGSNGTSAGIPFDCYKTLKISKKTNVICEFTNGTGATAIADCAGNNFFIIAFAQSATGNTPPNPITLCEMSYVARIKYLG